MVSVDIMHPPMDLENTSPLDPETDPPPLDLETDLCPEAIHSPALSHPHADQPQAFQTRHPSAHSFLANHPPIGFSFTEDVKTRSSSDIPTKVGLL